MSMKILTLIQVLSDKAIKAHLNNNYKKQLVVKVETWMKDQLHLLIMEIRLIIKLPNQQSIMRQISITLMRRFFLWEANHHVRKKHKYNN